jgi:hypothetical protein
MDFIHKRPNAAIVKFIVYDRINVADHARKRRGESAGPARSSVAAGQYIELPHECRSPVEVLEASSMAEIPSILGC